ncbi:MAG: GDP-L-fucose synthase family protein [Pseudomonadota bacterium]
MQSRFSPEGKRIWVAGHRGMVGQALVRRLSNTGCTLLLAGRDGLDLTCQAAVFDWVARERPDGVLLAAAKVGGILANRDHPADFLHQNLMIASNVIEASRRAGVAKLVFLASSAIYPPNAPQPMPESAILTGPLEPAHQWYALAKIAGIKLCQAYRRQYHCDFVSVIPTNLYGPGDRFDPLSSHVVPALIRRVHEAKASGSPTLTIWGTGNARREFLYVDDLADAVFTALADYSDEEPLNIGAGADVTILELTHAICRVIGYGGRIEQDLSKPDGPARKWIDSTAMRSLGWSPRTTLEDGLATTYASFLRAIEGAGTRA